MALIKCEECGKEISDKSKVCVNCGCPIQKIIKEEKNKHRKTFNELSKNERRELIYIMKREGLYNDGLISVLAIFNILFIIGLVVSLITAFTSGMACFGILFCMSILIENVYGRSKIIKYYNDNVDVELTTNEEDNWKL